ncbi:MAG: hypothetical protein HC857_15740 [Synechococcales cyanobacterium RU_4_20]|nr:hypothetical protein [Synechococcales cyanobacterium RU_4_20]NJR69793.1 hypothetical protein [Synechococcales cyanobacterium CRU_2_2]
MAKDFLMHPLAETSDPEPDNPWKIASTWANTAAGRVPDGQVETAIQACIAAAEYTKPGAGLMALGLASRAGHHDGVLLQLINLVAEGLLCRAERISE